MSLQVETGGPLGGVLQPVVSSTQSTLQCSVPAADVDMVTVAHD
jgi:hypothetical protein